MIEREMNLGQMAEALADQARHENERARALGPAAYAPPAVRRVHEEAQAGNGNGRAPQMEWPASEVERPVLEPDPGTPAIVHEAATDLAHVFEACAVEIERERDKLVERTEQVAQDATTAAVEIRAMKDRAVAALVEQTRLAKETSENVQRLIQELRGKQAGSV